MHTRRRLYRTSMVLLISLNSKLHCSSRVLSASHADREQVLDALLEIQRSLLCAPDANGDSVHLVPQGVADP